MTKPAIPEACLEQHLAILGKTGSGKTSTAKLAIEQVVAAGSRVCILDPIKSDWWGLTSSADGKKAGLPFDILGGPRGHVPLHAAAGKAIAEIVASGALPLSILDMADFGPGGQMQFFVDFAPVLLRKMRGVLYLVIEEAHIFAPKERAGFGSENMAIHWSKTIATAGRTKGIRLIVMTQRTQALHNAILGSCDTVITHRFTAPADQEPIIKWLKANVRDAGIRGEIVDGMSSLQTGEGWICSGEAKIFEKRKFPRIHTFDNSATPTDDSDVLDVKTAPVDQDKLRALIGTAVKDAEENDPKLLKQRIARLERELAKPRDLAVDTGALEKADHDEYLRGRAEALTGVVKVLKDTREHLTWALSNVDAVTHETGMAQLKSIPQSTVTPRAEYQVKRAPVARAPAISENYEKAAFDADLAPGERAILTACAQYAGGCDREQLSVLCGYKRSSRDTYIQRLKTNGLLAVVDNRLAATEAGTIALGDFERLPTGEALRDYWFARLPEGERKILQAVCGANDASINRDELSDLTGYKRSSRDTYLQRLRSRQLVATDGGMVRAAAILFD